MHIFDVLRLLQLPYILASASLLLRLHDNLPLQIQDRAHDQIQVYPNQLWQEKVRGQEQDQGQILNNLRNNFNYM